MNKIEGLAEELYGDKVVDRILGCIYGNALGDAYGLATEFLTRDKVLELYPDQDEMIPFPEYRVNRHNWRWDKGDWTDDTDQMILIMQMFVKSGGAVNMPDVARRLKDWIQNGFKELGDTAGMGIGQTVGNVVSYGVFEQNPSAASKSFWEKTGRNMAANGATMRTSIVGCVDFADEDKVIENTRSLTHLTHYDIRCTISSVMVTLIISKILSFSQSNPETEISDTEILSIIQSSQEKCKEILYADEDYDKETKDKYWAEFEFHANVESFEELNLDEGPKIGYTYKCFGSAVYSLKQQLKSKQSFKKVLDSLIRQAGDSDTNGAVAGALLGTALGYQQLPSDMLNALPNKEWLDEIVVSFIHRVVQKKSNWLVDKFWSLLGY